jgi:hypothetical protein
MMTERKGRSKGREGWEAKAESKMLVGLIALMDGPLPRFAPAQQEECM